MSAEFAIIHSATGSTLRGALRRLTTTGGKVRMIVVSTGAEEDRTVANWATYLITLTETPASSYAYVGDMPASVAAGWYALEVYDGTTIGSTCVETQVGYWDGTNWNLGANGSAAIALTVDSSGRAAADVKAVAGNTYAVATTTGNWATGGTWAAGSQPSAGQNVVVQTGVTVTVAATRNLGLFGSLTLEGSGQISIGAGVTVATVPAGWTVAENAGTITTNYGTVTSNTGTVTTNYGTVTTNTATGTVTNNRGTVETNSHAIVFNYGTVTHNADDGTVSENANRGWIKLTTGTVNNNLGIVTKNEGTVGENYGIVESNSGTVTTNNGTILYGTNRQAAFKADQMDLVNAPNATAVTAIQAGLATASAVSALPTAAANADAVWDEARASHVASGSFGAIVATWETLWSGITSMAHWLRALARSSTPNATALSEINASGGSYDATTDALQSARDAQLTSAQVAATIAATTDITVIAPNSASHIAIYKGDDYTAVGHGVLTFTKSTGETWPTTLSTVAFWCQPTAKTLAQVPAAAAISASAGVVTQATGDNQAFTVALTSTQTDTLTAGYDGYEWWVIANTATGAVTLRTGTMDVMAEPTARV